MDYNTKPYFSIIIPSYNRQDEIKELLDSLEHQDLSKNEFEIIIADDGSTDGTEQLVNDYKQKSSLCILLLKQDHQGPGAARNLGMENASGQIFIFVDSDCTAPANWLVKIKKTFEKDPTTEAFGGPDDAGKDFTPLLKAINYSMTSFLSTGGIRGGKKRRLSKFYPRSFNMGLRRELYNKIGGFGSLRHGQDIEFSNRIIKSGARVVYIPDAVVYHKRRTSLRKFFRQVYNWGVARINLYKIDAAMLEPVHALPAIALWSAFIVTLAAFFSTTVFHFWQVCAIIAVLLLIGSGIAAAIQWKNVKTGLMVPVVMVLQTTGYGLGFTFAFIWRVLCGRGEFVGFKKRYYK